MQMRIERISAGLWGQVCEGAYAQVFGENEKIRSKNLSFVLMGYAEDNPVMLSTILEKSKESILIQDVGAYPNFRGNPRIFRIARGMLSQLDNLGYKKQYTFIENSNIRSIKLALNTGFKIVGIRLLKGRVFCELLRTPAYKKGEH